MPKIIALVLATVLVGFATPAPAQSANPASRIFDLLPDVLGLKGTVRGHVVQHREATLVLRGDDRRTYTINTAALDAAAMRGLKEGQPVVVAVKTGGESTMPIASSVTPGEQAAKQFRRVEGTVESVGDDRITFRTHEGTVLALDRTRIIGDAPRVVANEPATLVYERDPQFAGVWIEGRDVQPSAAPGR
jgi:hypothetical protein